jgi:hypothetical protein
MKKSMLFGLCLAILVGATILILPPPAGMSGSAKSMLAVAAFTIMLWLFQVMNNAVASILMMGLMVLFIVMALAFFLMRFLDPTGFIAIPVLFLPVSDMMIAAGIPPLVLVAPLILSIGPFWLSHQNFWVAMGEGMTLYQAFSAGQRASLANVYGLTVLISIVVSVGYWKLIGLLEAFQGKVDYYFKDSTAPARQVLHL